MDELPQKDIFFSDQNLLNILGILWKENPNKLSTMARNGILLVTMAFGTHGSINLAKPTEQEAQRPTPSFTLIEDRTDVPSGESDVLRTSSNQLLKQEIKKTRANEFSLDENADFDERDAESQETNELLSSNTNDEGQVGLFDEEGNDDFNSSDDSDNIPILTPVDTDSVSTGESKQIYVEQRFNGECAPAAIAMLITNYSDVEDLSALMQSITGKFVSLGYLNIENGDTTVHRRQIVKYLSSLGFKVEQRLIFSNPTWLQDHFAKGGSSVIANIRADYLNIAGTLGANHWVLVDGVADIDGNLMIKVRDPLRGPEAELLPGIVRNDDGSILVPAFMWQRAASGVGVYVTDASDFEK